MLLIRKQHLGFVLILFYELIWLTEYVLSMYAYSLQMVFLEDCMALKGRICLGVLPTNVDEFGLRTYLHHLGTYFAFTLIDTKARALVMA